MRYALRLAEIRGKSRGHGQGTESVCRTINSLRPCPQPRPTIQSAGVDVREIEPASLAPHGNSCRSKDQRQQRVHDRPLHESLMVSHFQTQSEERDPSEDILANLREISISPPCNLPRIFVSILCHFGHDVRRWTGTAQGEGISHALPWPVMSWPSGDGASLAAAVSRR